MKPRPVLALMVVPLSLWASTLVAVGSAHAAVEVPTAQIWTMAATPDGGRVFVGAVDAGLLVVDAAGTTTGWPGSVGSWASE